MFNMDFKREWRRGNIHKDKDKGKSIPRNIVKLYTTKEVILKAARENSQIIYKGMTIRLTAYVCGRQNNVLPLPIAKISTLLSESECVTLHGKRNFAHVIKVTLQMRRLARLFRWTQFNHIYLQQ